MIYELREADFHEIRRMDEAESSARNGKRADDRECRGDHDPNRNGETGGDPEFPVLQRAIRTVTLLQGAIQSFPVLLGVILPARTEVDGRRR